MTTSVAAAAEETPNADDTVAAMDDEDSAAMSERRVWTASEDEKIAALVAEHGTRSWSIVAAKLPTRTGKQCRERWHNHLDPAINKGEWTI